MTLADRIDALFRAGVISSELVAREIENWRPNPIIDGVLKGETTFTREYKWALDVLNSVSSRDSLPQDTQNIIGYLEKCIGWFPSSYNSLSQRVASDRTLTTSIGAGVGLLGSILDSHSTRRTFLQTSALALAGLAFGSYMGSPDKNKLKELEKNARLLDVYVYPRLSVPSQREFDRRDFLPKMYGRG